MLRSEEESAGRKEQEYLQKVYFIICYKRGDRTVCLMIYGHWFIQYENTDIAEGQCLSWLQAHSILESAGNVTSLQSGQSHFMAKSNVGILTFMQSKAGPKDPVVTESTELHLPPNG